MAKVKKIIAKDVLLSIIGVSYLEKSMSGKIGFYNCLEAMEKYAKLKCEEQKNENGEKKL